MHDGSVANLVAVRRDWGREGRSCLGAVNLLKRHYALAEQYHPGTQQRAAMRIQIVDRTNHRGGPVSDRVPPIAISVSPMTAPAKAEGTRATVPSVAAMTQTYQHIHQHHGRVLAAKLARRSCSDGSLCPQPIIGSDSGAEKSWSD